jgi:Arc-like DNA binding domain
LIKSRHILNVKQKNTFIGEFFKMTKVKEEKAGKPKTIPINVRVPEDVGEKLKKSAEKNCRTITQEVMLAINKHVK